MITAARTMEQAIAAIRAFCDSTGIPIDDRVDPNRTGLIGPQMSGIATTLGNLEAKRTTTNPNFAALMVHLLQQAGVTSGDTVAIGSSASFPALMIATLAAAQALELYPVVITSLGASSHGATAPDFNMLDIYQVLLKKGIIKVPPAAVSLGGDRDVGRDFDPEVRARLIRQIHSSGLPFIFEPTLQTNVARRMKIYGCDSSTPVARAFINIGGSYANIGTSELVLQLKPGLTRVSHLPPIDERGVLFAMAAQGIPVIHLLYIKGLAMKYNLPWDPIPLPGPGEFHRIKDGGHQFCFTAITIIFLGLLIILVIYGSLRLH